MAEGQRGVMTLALVSDLTDEQQFFLAIVALIIWAGVMGGTLIAVVRSATLPPPVALVVSLTTVTLLTIAAFIVTEQQELATLAGMGLGSLSGAVAATWQTHKEEKVLEMRKLEQELELERKEEKDMSDE